MNPLFQHSRCVLRLLRSPIALCALALMLHLFTARNAACVELRIPDRQVRPGEAVVVPVMVDAVERLAGVKMVLLYDRRLLDFVSLERGPAAAAMLQVVNDRIPGKLIVVMACARGIQIRNQPLCTITFHPRNRGTAPEKTRLHLTRADLVREDLVPILATSRIGVVSFLPGKENGKPDIAATRP